MFFNSIKGRFFAFAVALSIVTILGTYIAQQKIETTSTGIAENMSERHQMHIITREINVHLFNSYKALDAYLLDPTRIEFKSKVHESIINAKKLTEELENHPWILEYEQLPAIQTLIEQLRAFDTATNELIEIRSNGLKLYPSLALANQELRPNRDLFNSAVFITLFELDQYVTNKEEHEIYNAFVQARQQWMQIVSTFRLYLANKIGSFNNSAIAIQETSIKNMKENLDFHLNTIEKFKKENKLGFISSNSFEDMKLASDNWYKGFLNILEIHHSDNWRLDNQIIKLNIEPLLQNISYQLNSINSTVRAAGLSELDYFSTVANKQTQLIWGVGLCALLFIVFIIFSIETLVLRPIASIAKAMKQEAFGNIGEPIVSVRSVETQDLIDTFTEMQSQVHCRQMELQHKALHDDLTKLPNRALLNDRLEQSIHQANRTNAQCALLLLDLDRFKEINDTLGHHVGDKVLVEISQRIKNELRESDTIARLGGDEFAIVLPNLNREELFKTVSRISNTIASPSTIDKMQLHIASSIGVAVYPTHGKDSTTLLKRADVAMYYAKRNNLNYAEYDAEEDSHSITRLSLYGDIKESIENNFIELHYQPLINIKDQTIESVEALVRWKHKNLTQIPTEELIAVSEQSGLISTLSDWVFEAAIKQCAEWQKQGFNISMAINLSVLSLHDAKLTERVSRLIEEYNLNPSLLTLEVTETAMMNNPKNAMDTLNKLSNLGVSLAIDDFGTGFSSLSYLKQLPVDKLKIDKSFVLKLNDSDSDEVIVRSTIELAHNLGINVIAEGVENQDTYNKLQNWNCDIAQGYLFSEAIPAQDVKQWVESYTVEALVPMLAEG